MTLRPSAAPRLLTLLLALLAAAALSSCSVDKYLQPGDKLLLKNHIVAHSDDGGTPPTEVKEALKDADNYCVQKLNKRFLGIRALMRIYCSTNPSDTSGWANFWRRRGEPPVVYDLSAANRTASQLASLLRSKGCFRSRVTFETEDYGTSGVVVRYDLWTGSRYQIDGVRFRCRQPEIDSLLQQWKDASLLKVGCYYDRDLLDKERLRLSDNLREAGYYYASKDLVHFIVDTTYSSSRLSILVWVRLPNAQPGDTNLRPFYLKKYSIDNIYIYPNITTDLAKNQSARLDTLVYPFQLRSRVTNYHFIHNGLISPNPKTISRSLFLYQGQQYRPRTVSLTSLALNDLDNFKFVEISFDESPHSTDTAPLLDARIRLLNSTKRRIGLSIELTNASDSRITKGSEFFTSGNIGLGSSINYRNKNLFGGAEVFDLEGRLLFELPKAIFGQKNVSFYDIFSTFENGLTATLELPSFLVPFSDRIRSQRTRPHTIFSLSTDFQFRKLVMGEEDVNLKRVRVGAGYGYTWSHNRFITHKLMPVNLTYSHNLDGLTYYANLFYRFKDIRFLWSFQNYVLLNTHYEFSYTNQVSGHQQNYCYFHTTVETAGNLLNGIANLLGSGQSGTIEALRNLTFSQYFLIDNEFKQYIHWDEQNVLVLRGLLGLSVPYGNSTNSPYEKLFVGGGPTTLRGWSLRHLGPGLTFSAGNNYIYGVGGVRLVANVEERFPIIGIFEGAVFLDAGNVWDVSDWGLAKDSRLIPSEILKGIALDGGVGLRLNISILTLRLDLALPLYDPGYYYTERWIFNSWKSRTRLPLTLNFGINYPF